MIKQNARQLRLAQALRENLLKRKEQKTQRKENINIENEDENQNDFSDTSKDYNHSLIENNS